MTNKMTKKKFSGRLPDEKGTITTHIDEYIVAWESLGNECANLFDGTLSAFDPNIRIYIGERDMVTLSAQAARTLIKNVNARTKYFPPTA